MTGLRRLVWVLLAAMAAATLWSSLREVPAAAILRLARDPWLAATLLEARSGALIFWIWIAYKEGCGRTRFVWLAALLLLGNLAAALYLLVQLARLPAGAKPEDLLLSSAACRLRA